MSDGVNILVLPKQYRIYVYGVIILYDKIGHTIMHKYCAVVSVTWHNMGLFVPRPLNLLAHHGNL